MNYPLVSKLLSVVISTMGLAFLLCLGVAWQLDSPEEWLSTSRGFLISILISSIIAAILFFSGRKANMKFFRREALTVIGISWIVASLMGSLPYIVIMPEIGIAGAVFESTSGLTTTGASVLEDIESLPRSLLFWRALSQWIGGMGVVVFFVAILGFLGAGAKMLYANEASGSMADFEESRVQTTIFRLIYLYGGMSVLCFLAYWLAGMEIFDAICHMFSTVATGGFSTRNASLASFNNPTIEWIAIVFMIGGAVSFLLILRLFSFKFRFIKKNTELKAFALLLLVSVMVIFLTIWISGEIQGVGHAFRASVFQTVSIITTSGFVTEDYNLWPALPQILLMVLMIIGGCSGSTSGGLKVARIIVIARVCLVSIEKSFRLRVIRPIKMNGIILNDRATNEVSVFVILGSMIILASVLFVSIFELHHPMDTILSGVQACLFNIGPGFGEIGPMENYSFFQAPTKLFLSLLMIMGRLELYAVLVLFAPSLWKRFE